MFGHAYFGGGYFGPDYFGPGVGAPQPVATVRAARRFPLGYKPAAEPTKPLPPDPAPQLEQVYVPFAYEAVARVPVGVRASATATFHAKAVAVTTLLADAGAKAAAEFSHVVTETAWGRISAKIAASYHHEPSVEAGADVQMDAHPDLWRDRPISDEEAAAVIKTLHA